MKDKPCSRVWESYYLPSMLSSSSSSSPSPSPSSFPSSFFPWYENKPLLSHWKSQHHFDSLMSLPLNWETFPNGPDPVPLATVMGSRVATWLRQSNHSLPQALLQLSGEKGPLYCIISPVSLSPFYVSIWDRILLNCPVWNLQSICHNLSERWITNMCHYAWL